MQKAKFERPKMHEIRKKKSPREENCKFISALNRNNLRLKKKLSVDQKEEAKPSHDPMIHKGKEETEKYIPT